MSMSIAGFLELQEIGHYRLKHRWQNMKATSFAKHQSAEHWWPEVNQAGLTIYHTERCGSRGCWACQHRARRKLRDKVASFVRTTVEPSKSNYRFVTLTLPGDWYDVRHADLETQFAEIRRAFRSWRLKMKRRQRPVSGFYTIELVQNSNNSNWHAHVHLIMHWKKMDYGEIRKCWTESVDRPMRKQLSEWTADKFTNDSRAIQVDPITSTGIGEYLTKVTNYVTKSNKDFRNPAEVAKTLYRRRTTGWLGEHYGFKENDTSKSISSI